MTLYRKEPSQFPTPPELHNVSDPAVQQAWLAGELPPDPPDDWTQRTTQCDRCKATVPESECKLVGDGTPSGESDWLCQKCRTGDPPEPEPTLRDEIAEARTLLRRIIAAHHEATSRMDRMWVTAWAEEQVNAAKKLQNVQYERLMKLSDSLACIEQLADNTEARR